MAADQPQVGSSPGQGRADDPLRALLAQLADGQVRTVMDLAGAMDADMGLVAQMLELLTRGGYLHETRFCDADSPACAGCHQVGLCRVMHEGRIWALTDKGLRAAGAR